MAFIIPNQSGSVEDPAGTYPQAQPDKVDIDILVAALAFTGVVTGCAVTAQGTPDMTVAVAAGSVTLGGAVPATVSSGNVTITAADATSPRFDLIVANSSGTKSATAGTPSSNPVFPAIPANSVVLAAVYIPAGATSITSARIIDKRAFIGTAVIPFTTTDNTIARFDGTTGKIQASGVTIDDSNNVSGIGTLGASGPITGASSLITTGINTSSAAANRGVLDYTGGTTRLISWGPDASTNGAMQLASIRSDGTNLLIPISFNAAGNTTVAGTLDVTGSINAAAIYRLNSNTVLDISTASTLTLNRAGYTNLASSGAWSHTGTLATSDAIGIGGAALSSSLADLHILKAAGSTIRLDRVGAGNNTIQSVETGVAYRGLVLDGSSVFLNSSGTTVVSVTSTAATVTGAFAANSISAVAGTFTRSTSGTDAISFSGTGGMTGYLGSTSGIVWIGRGAGGTLNLISFDATASNIYSPDQSKYVTVSNTGTNVTGALSATGTILSSVALEARSNTAAVYLENAANNKYWSWNLTGSGTGSKLSYFNGSSVVDQLTFTSGATSFAGTLGVSGNATLSGAANLIGGADASTTLIVKGATKGIRFGNQSAYSLIEGVDSTGTGSFQPLYVGGSQVIITNSGSTIATFASGNTSLVGTLGVSGDITATSRILLQTSATTPAPGSLGYNAGVGNYWWAKAGGTYDFVLYNNAGAAVFAVPTGTANFSAAAAVTVGSTLDVGSGITFGPGSFSTLTNGQGRIYGNTAHGAVIYGQGSTNDILLVNSLGSTVFNVPTGTINLGVAGALGIGTSPSAARVNIVGGSLGSGGFQISQGLTTGRAGTYDATTLSALHTYQDDSSVEISAGSSAANVSGISMTGLGATNYKNTVRIFTGSTEAMRVDSSQYVMIGTTSAIGSQSNTSVGATFAKTYNWLAITDSNYVQRSDNTDGSFFSFYKGSSHVGGISTASGVTAYNTTSDYRAKDVFGEFADAGKLIDAVKVYNGRMKGTTIDRPMFIAHELQSAAAWAVTGGKDAVDKDGKPVYQQVDHASLIPLLTAEIQSLRARLKRVEAR